MGFYFNRPKSHYASETQVVLDAPKYVTKTPDVDNLVKLVLDSLQGVVYKDDKVVSVISAEKRWAPFNAFYKDGHTDLVIAQFKSFDMYEPRCMCASCDEKRSAFGIED